MNLDTSRQKKPHEVEGQDYFFVSREQIEREILEGKFLECGEYNGNIYGTSVSSVHEIIDSGHVAVITPHDQVSYLLTQCVLEGNYR